MNPPSQVFRNIFKVLKYKKLASTVWTSFNMRRNNWNRRTNHKSTSEYYCCLKLRKGSLTRTPWTVNFDRSFWHFIKLKEFVLSVSDEKNGFCHVNFNRPKSGMNEPHEHFPSFDFTHSAVASFLDYIYTGQINLTSEARAKEIHTG